MQRNRKIGIGVTVVALAALNSQALAESEPDPIVYQSPTYWQAFNEEFQTNSTFRNTLIGVQAIPLALGGWVVLDGTAVAALGGRSVLIALKLAAPPIEAINTAAEMNTVVAEASAQAGAEAGTGMLPQTAEAGATGGLPPEGFEAERTALESTGRAPAGAGASPPPTPPTLPPFKSFQTPGLYWNPNTQLWEFHLQDLLPVTARGVLVGSGVLSSTQAEAAAVLGSSTGPNGWPSATQLAAAPSNALGQLNAQNQTTRGQPDQTQPAPSASQVPAPISADNAQSIGGAGAGYAPAQFDSRFDIWNNQDLTSLDPAFGGGIGAGPNIFRNDIWGRNGGGSNAALSQLLAMANADLAAGRACLANPEGCSGTLPYSPGQVQTVANQVLKEAGANAVNARAASQTVNSPSGATPSSTVSGLSAQRPGGPTVGQRIATVAPAGSSGGVEPTNSTVHTTVAPQLSSASHGNPNPPSGAAPGANASGISSVTTRTGSAVSSVAARGASSAASSATSQAASAAAANAASRAASNAASRTASAAAANAASRAASAAAANAASRVRIPTVSDIRLKRDIVEVGQLPDGLHLYRYRYLWSDTVYVGVMAQEVLTIAPDAVVRGNDGYLRVDYGRLGLQLTTWDQWTGRGRERATDRQ